MSRTCSNAQTVGTMILAITVTSTALTLDISLSGIFTTYIDGLTILLVVAGKLVKKASHTQLCTVSIVEVGMCHFQATIDDTHHHTLTRISLGQTGVFIDGRQVNPIGCNVHLQLAARMVFDALYPFVIHHCLQLADRYIGNVYVANLCDSLTSVFAHHCLSVAAKANHGANHFMLFDT